jgi:hypothetical protein
VFSVTPTLVIKDKHLYLLNAPVMPFNSTNFQTEFDLGRWILLSDETIFKTQAITTNGTINIDWFEYNRCAVSNGVTSFGFNFVYDVTFAVQSPKKSVFYIDNSANASEVTLSLASTYQTSQAAFRWKGSEAQNKIAANKRYRLEIETISIGIYSAELIAYDTAGGGGEGLTPEQAALLATVPGKKPFHGVVARPVGASNPLPTHITTTTFPLGATANPISYYFNGELVEVTADKTATLTDGTAGLYFVYFNAATGNILATKNFPGVTLGSNVIIATVLWNGTDYGLVNDERHGYKRDGEWHLWAHKTVGARYVSGINFTPTGTGAAATFSSTSGEIADEDIQFVINPSSAFPTAHALRTLFQTGAASFDFDKTTSAIPYKAGTGSRPVYVNGNTYALTTAPSANNRFLNFFIYGTTDLHTPLYCFPETITAANVITDGGHRTTALARVSPFPNLAALGLSPELKALFRLIVRADGVVQTQTSEDDYRTVSSLPQAAGNTSTSAAAVSFAPTATVLSSTVQTAIEEVDDKALFEVIQFASSDESTPLTIGTSKMTFRMPYAMTLSKIKIDVVTAPTGSTLIVNIKESGTTILSTKLSIDATEKTSETAATAAVISDTSLADNAEMTVDIDQVGATIAGAGLKVTFRGKRA